jgi:DNA-binding transcriptional MerR regulator
VSTRVNSSSSEIALDDKAPSAFRTISEVADELDLPQHVLRFWESRFREIKPMKRGGGRRYYRPYDIDLLRGIRHLLYGEGYTIRGAQRILREQGIKFVQTIWQEGAPPAPPGVMGSEGFIERFAAEEIKLIEDRATWRGGLASLIDQNSSEPQDSIDSRREPQFNNMAPPRGALADSAVVDAKAPKSQSAASLLAGTANAATLGKTLASDDLHKLRAALNDLTECRNIISVCGDE